MIPVLGIPHYNRPELLARCIASIDYPVQRLVIIQNGRNKEMPIFEAFDGQVFRMWWKDSAHGVTFPSERIRRLIIIRHPNAGVAASWNEIIKLFPAPWWMLVNNDIQFTPGDLEKMATAANAQPETGKLYGNHGASFFVITAHGVDTVGLFDENIYPAYLEDCDWAYRADLLQVTRRNVDGVNAVHGDGKWGGSCTVNATEELQRANMRTHRGNFNYYRRKWGGLNGTEAFRTPFDAPGWPVWSWRFETQTRKEQQWEPQ